MDEVEQFTGQVIKFGDSLGVTIPVINVKFSGLKSGQFLKVYFKIVTPPKAKVKKEKVKNGEKDIVYLD